MRYDISYEFTALVFLICIAVHFFTKKSYPSRLNRLFGLYLLCGMADIILDIIGVHMITHASSVSLWLNYAVNIAYYLMQMIMPYLLFAYVLMLTERRVEMSAGQCVLANSGLAVISALIIATPFTRMIFFYDENLVYTYGRFSFLTYIFSTGYIAATDVVLIRNRRKLSNAQFHTILSFTLISCVGIIIQFLHNELLVTGVAMAVCITLLYLTLQNTRHMTDDATNLLDKRSFDLYLKERMLVKSKKCYVLVAGVSDVKALNLALGMSLTGDLIGHLASVVLSSATNSTCFRLSDDQFAVVCDSADEARRVAWSLAREFNATQKFMGYEIATSGRVAYMSTSCQNYALNDVLHIVEHMSDMVRDRKREAEICVDKKTVQKIIREEEIITAMREALSGPGFDVYLQPMYSPEKAAFTQAEALLRFSHPTLGQISPEECIPLAERNGLMVELGEMVLRRVCEYERDYGVSRMVDCISINASEAEMLRENGADRVLGILAEYGVSPHLIRYELTETIATSSYGGISRNMRALHDAGVTFSLDDFGCGYANFDSFMIMPFDAVKLDRSILNAASASPRARVVMHSIIKMIHDIDVKVVVEGAESIEQVQLLLGMGVDSIQGFFYTRAIPIKAYIEFISEAQ